jgi:CheY-like chemotaxis protein
MEKQILVVHTDPGMRSTIIRLIHEICRDKGMASTIIAVYSQAEAKDFAAQETFDLIVTALDVPAGTMSASSSAEEGIGGLELIRELREIHPDLAAVVTFTGSLSGELLAKLIQNNINMVPEAGDIAPTLTNQVCSLLDASEPVAEPKPTRVDLEITLDKEDHICTYQFQCEGNPSEPAQVLSIDPEQFEELVDESREVIAKPRWQHELHKIGKSLGKHLFQDTPQAREFRDKFNQWLGAVHGMNNMRIRFVVKQDLHPIALEALVDERAREEESQYWMLQSPIYRRLYRREAPPGLQPRALFQDEETAKGLINVLIIAADASGYAGELKKSYDQLPSLAVEVEMLETELKENRQKYHIGKIKVIRREELSDGVSFKQAVEKSLTQGNWHVVHYVGHTDLKDDSGYVLFPRSGISPIEPVKISDFAWWLARSHFVFLSSCESAEKDFLFHLAEEDVPAVLGFRWKVSDPKALDFARCFYKHLFSADERSLEYAFLEARKQMFRHFPGDPIWAAAVLVMQIATEEVRHED